MGNHQSEPLINHSSLSQLKPGSYVVDNLGHKCQLYSGVKNTTKQIYTLVEIDGQSLNIPICHLGDDKYQLVALFEPSKTVKNRLDFTTCMFVENGNYVVGWEYIKHGTDHYGHNLRSYLPVGLYLQNYFQKYIDLIYSHYTDGWTITVPEQQYNEI